MSIRITRVYTRAGDQGMTRLAGGQERKKHDARLEAYGTIDELNAVTGVLLEELLRAPLAALPAGIDLAAMIRRVQHELFDLGAELATLAEDRHPKQIVVTDEDVERLEREMDAANEHLPALRTFVLPGGGMASALFHQARTVCRRGERRLTALHDLEPQRGEVLRFVNRLSDWFFVMGRLASVGAGREELLWKPGER